MSLASNNPVAIVTGAASGIGKAIALTFARAGYHPFLVDWREERLNQTIREYLPSFRVGYHCGDVSVISDVQAGLTKCLAEFGRIDVLVANAAIMQKVSFLEMSETHWDQTMSINLKGVFLWGQAVAQWMVQHRHAGKIINIVCMRAELATENLAAYITSKGGVKQLTKAMAVELAQFGIRVNGIEPGRTMTEGAAGYFANDERRKRLEELIPLKRFAEAEEIARVALFLASEEADYMTGAIIPVDGGYTSGKE